MHVHGILLCVPVAYTNRDYIRTKQIYYLIQTIPTGTQYTDIGVPGIY